MTRVTNHIDIEVLNASNTTRDANVLVAITDLINHSQIQISATELWMIAGYLMSTAVKIFGKRVPEGDPQWPKCPKCANHLIERDDPHNTYACPFCSQ
jgi:hypothetical protein